MEKASSRDHQRRIGLLATVEPTGRDSALVTPPAGITDPLTCGLSDGAGAEAGAKTAGVDPTPCAYPAVLVLGVHQRLIFAEKRLSKLDDWCC
jgi:hypothetical protein